MKRVFLSLGNEKEKKKNNNKKQKKIKELNDEDVVKLALLYLLEKEDKNLIDMQWVALVDNWKAFNKYPWAKICYKWTLFGLERDLANRVSKFQDKNKREKLDLKHIVLWDLHMPSRFGHMRLFHYLN